MSQSYSYYSDADKKDLPPAPLAKKEGGDSFDYYSYSDDTLRVTTSGKKVNKGGWKEVGKKKDVKVANGPSYTETTVKETKSGRNVATISKVGAPTIKVTVDGTELPTYDQASKEKKEEKPVMTEKPVTKPKPVTTSVPIDMTGFNGHTFGRDFQRRARAYPRSSGASDCLKMCLDCTGSIIAIIVILALTFGLSIASIVIGAEGDCEKHGHQDLKVWLIVYGSVGIFSAIIQWLAKKEREANDGDAGPFACCNLIVSLFMLSWLVVGSIWVYNYDTGPGYQHCDDWLFLFMWWVVTIAWCLLGLLLILMCCLVCVMLANN